ISRIHQDQAPDHRIELFVESSPADVAAHERDLLQAPLPGASCRRRDDLRVHVDPDDVALVTDKLRHEERDVPGTTTHAEYSQAWRDPGGLEQEPGWRFEERSLRTQSSFLVLGTAHRVRGLSRDRVPHPPPGAVSLGVPSAKYVTEGPTVPPSVDASQ